MRLIGKNNHNEFERDPQLAWQRGKVLDAMLATALVPHLTGVWRLSHSQMNAMDLKRQFAQAATVNKLLSKR